MCKKYEHLSNGSSIRFSTTHLLKNYNFILEHYTNQWIIISIITLYHMFIKIILWISNFHDFGIIDLVSF